jgi:hypothetical protein
VPGLASPSARRDVQSQARSYCEEGYLLSLVRSRGPTNRGALSPNFHESHFVLRDARSTQNLFCLDSIGSTPLMIGGAMYYLINAAAH